MKSLTRGSVVLVLFALIFGAFYFQTPTANAITIANNSKEYLQQEKQEKQEKQDKQDNKQINKPSNTQEISTEIKDSPESTPSSGGEKTATQSFTATAYCLKGRTASGSGVRRGVVAADPRVLPLGTRISMNAGSYSGDYLVADTGGSVKGRKLDVWVASCSEAKRFGRKSVKIRVKGR
jgi:3D (Asp-Asp-Asp) domain-containing protein